MIAARTTIVMPPATGFMNVETRTCVPPRIREETARLTRDDPDRSAIINELMSHENPMLGLTLDKGVMSAPAIAASAEPRLNDRNRTQALFIPSA